MCRKGLFERPLDKYGVKGVNLLTTLGKSNTGRGNFKCRAPDTETYLHLFYEKQQGNQCGWNGVTEMQKVRR